MRGRFHTCPSLSSPEAEPEAQAYVLLFIKEYNSQEEGVWEKAGQGGREKTSRVADCSISKASIPKGNRDSISGYHHPPEETEGVCMLMLQCIYSCMQAPDTHTHRHTSLKKLEKVKLNSYCIEDDTILLRITFLMC